MFTHRSFSDTAFPDREIRFKENLIEFWEKGQMVHEAKAPKCDIDAFVLGIFEGFKYEANEMRSILFTPKK